MNETSQSDPVGSDCKKCSEFQFRILAEQLPDVVIRMDAEGRFLYVNARIQNLTGYEPEQFIGKTCREVGMSDECMDLWMAIARDTLEGGIGIDREVHVQLLGRMRSLHIRTVVDAMSQPQRAFIATVRDITMMRRNERQIHELVQRLNYHMNNTPLAVMEWDTDGRCLIWNGEAEEMFGWMRRELKTHRIELQDLIHPDDRAGFGVLLERLKTGCVVSDYVKCRVLHRDGALLYCECHLSALLDSEGRAKSILWVANDVTDRVRAEQEMHKLNSSLAERIQQRTTELESSNKELQREIIARKELEAELISISEREHRRVGHDLHDGVCQELSGVRFSLEAISKRRRKGTLLRQQMDQLTGAIERAVHHIRLLSRGLAPLELEDGNLAAALEDLAANTSALFQIKCTFKCRGRSQRLPIEKAIHIFRIAQEAIQNAIKHGESTLVCVDLDLLGGALSITDNGHGIKEGDSAPARGNGMGLRIMRHRAAALQGEVSIERIPVGGMRVFCQFSK